MEQTGGAKHFEMKRFFERIIQERRGTVDGQSAGVVAADDFIEVRRKFLGIGDAFEHDGAEFLQPTQATFVAALRQRFSDFRAVAEG